MAKIYKLLAACALTLAAPTAVYAADEQPPCKSGAAECKPWERDWPTKEEQEFVELFRTWKDLDEETPSYETIWQFSGGRTDFRVTKADVTNGSYGSRSVWVRGDHRKDASVKYRSSVWRYTLDCAGYATLTAYSTYDANGANLDSWDGSSRALIRPDTMISSLEYYLCK